MSLAFLHCLRSPLSSDMGEDERRKARALETWPKTFPQQKNHVFLVNYVGGKGNASSGGQQPHGLRYLVEDGLIKR